MNILIAGGSGFIGKALISALQQQHTLTVLGREKNRLEQCFPNQSIHKITWDKLHDQDAKQFEVIINLSGANIGAKRWTNAVKKELIESRTLTNTQLIEWLIKQEASPRYFCANAVGIYGAEYVNNDVFDEDSQITVSPTNDFLKQIGLAWEQSLRPAVDKGIHVTTLRFGVVLKKGEGMLKKLELPFRLGLGTILGSGQQVISWVHYKDLVNAVLFLLERPDLTGPINITSPNPVSQKEFAIEFARVLKRPLFLKLPAPVVKILFGEMGEYLLLKGQKVRPKRLTESGFKFSYPYLDAALMQEYKGQLE